MRKDKIGLHFPGTFSWKHAEQPSQELEELY